MAWTKRKKGEKTAPERVDVCPHCGAPLKKPLAPKPKKWHERTSVTLCIAAGLVVIGLGFVHIITGVISPYSLPFDIVRKDVFGYRETFVNATKIRALPYLVAKTRYPLGCKALQKADYLPSGKVFETRTIRHLRDDMSRWQAEFEHALGRPRSGIPSVDRWHQQLRGKIQIFETDPSDPNACNNRGIDSARNAQYETAIAEFSRAVRRNPTFADAYYNRALVYVALGQLGQAVSDLTAVVGIRPEFVEAYRSRGILQMAMSQYDQAISDFSKVLELDPESGDMHLRRSLAFYAKGQYEEAWADARRMQGLGLPVPPGFIESLRAASRE
ncbi:MAG: tetratricopeptide repeat protein [Phycisphaerales bacterium]|nr:MAG: tetratricopeptide repeat protein [Phycisphaerales bacterium]